VPRLPRPNADAWPDAVVDELTHVVELAGGRTLALFTSHRMLRRTVAEVRDRLPDHRILAQGDAPTRALQAEFLDDEHASLFATASFWTGISSPGTTCSAVVIDKIPFPVPTDPIVEARCEAVGDARAFGEVSVPAAGMQLAQGVGRLIRTATDRGVVAVLDPRLAEAGSGRHAEQIGIGQGISKHALVRATGHGQHRSGQQAQDQTRGAELPEHRGLQRIQR
jgi:ATP-dependent DNA helicase DinG